MKIVCDCGNELEFLEKDETTGKPNDVTYDEGLFVTRKDQAMSFWGNHDQIGIVCNECGKAIWLFT